MGAFDELLQRLLVKREAPGFVLNLGRMEHGLNECDGFLRI